MLVTRTALRQKIIIAFKVITSSVAMAVILSFISCKSSSSEILCGGAMNFVCPSDMYCHLKAGCGGIDAEGVCKTRPLQCKAEKKTVCGCDGETYSSECFAAAKGVTSKSIGACVVSMPTVAPTEAGVEEDLEDELGEVGE